MYPFFEPYPEFLIYTFGLTLTLCFFLFLWMIHKLAPRYNYDVSIFTKNILWYFLSVLIFSRLFYVIWKWEDLKYIKNPFEFFVTSDYNFSLIWALFGFILVFVIQTKINKDNINKYIDPLVISFIFVLFIGYIWAFFWWQVFWRDTHFWIELLYTHPFTPIPYQVPIFPLSIIYSVLFFILFSILYILSMYIHLKSLLWYIWMIIFSCILLIFEFFSWKTDILKDSIWMNLTQLFVILLIFICSYRLFLLMKENEWKEITILHKN